MIMKRKFLIISLISVIGILTSFFASPLTSAVMKIYYGLSSQAGLVGYWNFDSSASTPPGLADLSGNANQGTGYSGATPTNLSTASSSVFTGKIGNGGLFDGSDDYVSIASFPSMTKTTWSTWVKLSAYTST